MAKIRVISAGEPTTTTPTTPVAAAAVVVGASPGGASHDGTTTDDGTDAADNDNDAAAAAAVDGIDRHNRPRARRDAILSSLRTRYSRIISSFDNTTTTTTAATSSSSTTTIPSANYCDMLIDLYRPVHDPAMVRFLIEAWPKWSAMGPPWDKDSCHPGWKGGHDDDDVPPLVPIHSAFRRGGPPCGTTEERPSDNVMGAIGYYCTDAITPVVGSLARELAEDALAICTAVDRVFENDDVVAYAVTTHPGHHASRDCFGGYCYLNNAALCARLMQRRIATGSRCVVVGGDDGGRVVVGNYWGDDDKGDDDDDGGEGDGDGDGERGGSSSTATTNRMTSQKKLLLPRVAIIDVDYHCGNGTASIFYDDPSVFFASIHIDPEIDYPWNSGYADQRGAGGGTGTTMHVPLPKGATWDDVYGRALRDVMSAIAQFEPKALVVSLGLDTHEGDDVAVNRGGFALRDRDYYEMGLCMGRYMAGKRVPCVFVQEGGYKMDVVGDAASDVVGGYAVGMSSGEEEKERGGGGGGR